MFKQLTAGLTLMISVAAFSQVGIETETPQATLDVVGKPADASVLDGIIAPRLEGAQLRAKTYTTDQTGALVYVTLADTAPAGQTEDVTAEGYYYFNGTKWVILGAGDMVNIYNSDGALIDQRTLDINGEALTFKGSTRNTHWDSDGRIYQESTDPSSEAVMGFNGGDNSNLYIQQWNNGNGSVTASGNSTGLLLATHYTTDPAPINFNTSPGGNTMGIRRMTITGEGNVGIQTELPTERLDNEGITRLRDLPLNGATNAHHTQSDGEESTSKDQTFIASRTLVADANGVLGYVTGLPTEPLQIQGTTDKAVENTDNVYQMGSVAIGNISAYTDADDTKVLLDVAGATRIGTNHLGLIGENSTTIGDQNEASGLNSIAFGIQNKASNINTFVAGINSEASGYGSRAMGEGAKAKGSLSTAIGISVETNVFAGVVLGENNGILGGNPDSNQVSNSNNAIFQIGNSGRGSDDSFGQGNAVTVLRNGNVAIGVGGTEDNAKPTERLDIGIGNENADQKGSIRIRAFGEGSYLGDITTDNIVVADADGVLKIVPVGNLTGTVATGFERLPDMTATDFYWRLIGAPTANYGTAGKYSVDASWNPTNLSEILVGISYNTVLAYSGLSISDLGARGQNSFTAGTMNSASGAASTALGGGNQTSASGSFAAGLFNKATGDGSIAMGQFSRATVSSAIALGNTSLASGENAVAIGQANEATAQGTLALGNTNKATAISGIAMGQANEANGQSSIAIGNTNIANGQSSVAIGHRLTTSVQYSTAMGLFNKPHTVSAPAERLFVIGNGTGDSDALRSDAFTVLKNGKVGVDIDNFETTTSNAKLEVNGQIRVRPETTAVTCNTANEGSIRYFTVDANNGEFRGCKKTAGAFAWVSL